MHQAISENGSSLKGNNLHFRIKYISFYSRSLLTREAKFFYRVASHAEVTISLNSDKMLVFFLEARGIVIMHFNVGSPIRFYKSKLS